MTRSPGIIATLASGSALPSTCVPASPGASDTVAFVASGHAWSLSRNGDRLTCLFDVADPGPFQWGPLGDRALLGGLEVKGLAGAPTLPPSVAPAGPITWSQPTGKSIVFTETGDTMLEKAHLDGTPQEDVTPLASGRYLSVTYHPSGLAFAFAVERPSRKQSIWISSNTGTKPERLVFSNEGTTFGAIAFDVDGTELLYGAVHADGHPALHSLDLTDPAEAPALWDGLAGQRILDIRAGLDEDALAWTVGTSCDDSVAMAQTPDGTTPVLESETRPTRAVGWLDGKRVLVASGGCQGPLDLTAVNVFTGSATPLVFGVDAASVRTAAPTPPPPLPKAEADVGSGFA